MNIIFKYSKTDKRTRRLTLMWFLICGGLFFTVGYFFGEGGYLTAWVVSVAAALILLCVLSIPRNIDVGDGAVEIRCVVEITRIPISDMRSVRRVERQEMKRMFPVLAGHGFFGYYGYYLDTEKWETVKLYCTRWNNFVEITDIYEKRFYVNSSDPDALVSAITRAAMLYVGEK